MARSVARTGDTVTGLCRGSGHVVNRPFTGTWGAGSSVVKANNIGVIRVGDTGTTDCGHTFTATGGSSVATADGRQIHGVGNSVTTEGGGTGSTTTGSPTVTCP